MRLEDMSAKHLRDWVYRLQIAIQPNSADTANIPLYKKWLAEAQQEQTDRYNRRLKYMEAMKHGKQEN